MRMFSRGQAGPFELCTLCAVIPPCVPNQKALGEHLRQNKDQLGEHVGPAEGECSGSEYGLHYEGDRHGS